jgi:peptidoglycan/LPS O-acetylase OafA/YrhL
VGVFLGVLVVFRRRANRAGTLWKELSLNAYGVYVLHAPLIVGLALVLTGVPIPALLKLLVAILVAITLCFTVAGLVRRLPSRPAVTAACGPGWRRSRLRRACRRPAARR